MSFSVNAFTIAAKKQDKSQEFIDACIDYAKKLSERNLPVLFSLEHLAIEIGVESNFIRLLNGDAKRDDFDTGYMHKYTRYNYFKLKKKKGGYREIMVPAKDLKYIQKWILVNILSEFPLNDSCKGFRKGVSIYDNAKVHERAETILKVDLLKFYDTITEKRVYGIFKAMGYVENLAFTLAKLTTARHRPSYWKNIDEDSKSVLSQLVQQQPAILPQGAPTSPMLANIAATRMDIRFEKLAKAMKFNYSRYADDLTFSVNKDGKLPSINQITGIINEEKFFINKDKISYMKKGGRQYVTGLTTTNGINLSKRYRKDIAQHIFYCRKNGVEKHLEWRKEDFPGFNNIRFHNWLYGHICFIKSINKEASAKLLEDFNKINWSID